MVVLYHHLVGEIQPVGRSTAGQDRVNVEEAETWGGLPGVQDPGAGALYRVHVHPGQRRDPRCPLQEIQQGSFGTEYCPEIPLHRADYCPGKEAISLAGGPTDSSQVTLLRDRIGIGESGNDSRRAEFDDGRTSEMWGDGQLGGDVMRAIFDKRFPGYPCGVRIDVVQAPSARSPLHRSPFTVHRPRATIRSRAPRARFAMSGGTLTW